MDELIGELHDKLSNLKSHLASATTQEALEVACLLDESGLSDAISEIIDNADEWTENHSKEELAELNSQLGAIEKKAADSKSKSGKIDIFDEIRTAISAIPIRFAFRNSIMTENDHNTTSIPFTYTASPATPHYFGVSSVSKYISSLTMLALDEYLSNADDTGLYSLVKGIDDPLNRKENEKYLIATRNEIKQFQAKDATGEVTFHVWLETADKERVRLASADTLDFERSCNNSAAVMENNVLIFTGEGLISVRPLSHEDAVLHVEDSNGNQYGGCGASYLHSGRAQGDIACQRRT